MALTDVDIAASGIATSRWWLAIAILVGQITLAFSMFAVAVALPNIMNALSADVTSIHWVMTGFQIARTVPMPALGWCSSLVGHRNLYIAGLVITVVATMCCGLAWNLPSLICFRVLQGLGAAPAQVTGMVILYEAFPPSQRGLVLGLLLLAGSLGPTIGPSLGGYLVQTYSWRAMFYLALPTAVISLILAPMVLPKRPRPARPALDLWGLLSMAIWVVALLLAISQGQRQGWNSTYIYSLFTIAAGFFVVFVWIECRRLQPFVDLRLYRNTRFVLASIAGMLFDSAFNSANFLSALMLQQVFLFTPAHTGLILAPGALVMGLVGVGAGRLADFKDPLWPILLGLFLQATAMYALGQTTLFSGTLWLTFLVLIYRMSFGCVHSPLTKMILSTLPPDRLSMGSGLDGIHRGFASAFGIALGSVILERRTAMHVISLSETHELSTSSVQEAIDATAITLQQTGLSVTDPERHPLLVLWWQLLEQARVLAYQETFLVLSGVTLLALLPAIWARREKP